jgi:hypothetical protein
VNGNPLGRFDREPARFQPDTTVQLPLQRFDDATEAKIIRGREREGRAIVAAAVGISLCAIGWILAEAGVFNALYKMIFGLGR